MSQPDNPARPLKVSIVGAGVGGLAAAVSLRRCGHNVTIYESSENETEIGAGLGIQTNALRVLQRFGYARENLKPLDFDGVTSFNAKSGESSTFPFAFSNPSQELHALNCHRSDLHDELKRLATGQGEGPPAQLHFKSKVVACDPEAGTITVSDGEVITADLVLGADGIHSVVRTSILGQVVKAVATGRSCFRCLFDTAKLSEFSELDWLSGEISGPRNVIRRDDGPFLMFWIYAVRSGSLINFVGMHEDAHQDEREWVSTATKAEVLDMFQEFQPKFLRILDLPTAMPILRWQLRAMPLLPTWIRGRAALLGDAAHATLPLLGQGAAMAIEDAGTLGCLLPFGTRPDQVPSRLEAYQLLRKSARRVCEYGICCTGKAREARWLCPISRAASPAHRT
ncbi:FAD/NAD(P)-binding domain-containing protein [Mycena sanguinolenta]|uniref:FAD/NAD(P)-binding domain-containing protein n=1 Tax=Mycena sanguinolenta TaxID=230812 RepID=A0A8H6XJD0_9AGAR|nr:FAD/NAD(P)-binding domain-containing protein [Mycena sanguinolenta]